jgi:hypothetical protein
MAEASQISRQRRADRDANRPCTVKVRYGAGDAAQPHFPIHSLGFRSMPPQTLTTRPILHDIPVGSDFVGGAEAMPVRPGEPGPVVPGSDFVGGALPLTAEVERGQPNEERAA